jgi:Ribbon-helix-helix protein, copG family
VKTITVRLPEGLAAEIESESRAAGVSKSDVVRRRLEGASPRSPRRGRAATFFDLAADLIGGVDDAALPKDLSAHRKLYLRKLGYGQSRHR